MSVALIDYGSGNLHSAEKSLARVAESLDKPPKIVLAKTAEAVAAADRIVLPGVGAFHDCRAKLKAIDGLEEVLCEQVRGRGKPFLGICVGMQLLFEKGLEEVETAGLGWLAGEVVPLTFDAPFDAPSAAADFPAPETALPFPASNKIPHMGWNSLRINNAHPVFDGLENENVYFVHSYVARAENTKNICAVCDYGGEFVAGVAHETFCGTQFHPEKSQAAGLSLLQNFLEWKP